MAPVTACLVGNPNCGKTTVFNALTGARQRTGNWPGVTVEKKTGSFAIDGCDITIVDLPGVYSLAVTADSSLDERIAREYILSGEAQVVVDIVDASNLERNLYLSAQLIEMGVPLVVALNMMDVASEHGVVINVDRLAARLGCPVVPLVANRGLGIDELARTIARAAAAPRPPHATLAYAPPVEQAIDALAPALVADHPGVPPRWLAVKLLEGDEGAAALTSEPMKLRVAAVCEATAAAAAEDLDILIADGRYGFAHALIEDAVSRKEAAGSTLSDRIDRIVLHRLFGIPIFLAVMYVVFFATINVGGAFIDLFEGVTGALLVDGLEAVMAAAGSPPWLTLLIAGGIGGGVQTVATFIPIIACLYLCLSVLEDSGYMARAAFVMDRLMRGVGLPGKSFIPLIVGFGCNVPAIMATRTLDSRRDRIVTVMMAPFMSCGARLPVYALFVAAFFPSGGQNVVFALYLIGILFALFTGLALRHTLLGGEATPFLMELPPYHRPTLNGLIIRTWDRLKTFTLRAGRVIVAVFVVLHLLGSVGTDGTMTEGRPDSSVLAAIGQAITPALAPMGIGEDNWPATVGMLSGLFAKEAVVGTLSALYGALGTGDAGADGAGPWAVVATRLADAFVSVPENFAALTDRLLDPLGFGTLAEPAAVDTAGVLGEMANRFDGAIAAFAYLLAVLLYMPCLAAMAAIQREVGSAWAAFAALWTTGLGYGAAVVCYQAGTFSRHPQTAALSIAAVVAVVAVVILIMRALGARRPSHPAVGMAGE
jgi:ferrous iron transport protein B